MESNLRSRSDDERGMAALVGDIIQDAQKLIRQELALARTEIQCEWTKAKSAAVVFSAAAAVCGLGGILLAFALVHGLGAITGLPLWLDYAIFSAAFFAVGLLLFVKGRGQARQVDFVPHETVNTVKENVQWIKNQT